MKTVKLGLALIAFLIMAPAQAQTADEIISTYFENIGGADKLKALKGMKITASLNQSGMVLPLEIIRLSDGRTATSFSVQGQKYNQETYDGESLWGHNMMTQKAEKSDAETTANFKLGTNDFPDEFINYKEKGYTAELLGKETIDGTEAFQIKLTKEPVTVDGKEEESVSYYFFDAENFVPVAMRSEIKSGPGKGMTQETTFSDYQEIDGLYFAYSMNVGVQGQPTKVPITVESIELNPEVDDAVFAFPDVMSGEEKKE